MQSNNQNQVIAEKPNFSASSADRPLVSVVTAFFNAEEFLSEAIESVLAQSYGNWELLLIDDGSNDKSTVIACDYAAKYPDRIFYVQHEDHQNRGAAASRNVGVRLAQGEYVAILDADDIWLSNKLTEQVAILVSEPRAAMVYGVSVYWHSWSGKPEDLKRDYAPELGIAGDRLYEPPSLLQLLYPLGTGCAPCPSDLLIRRSVLMPDGGFEEQFTGEYQLYEDQAFLAKIYLTSPVFVSSQLFDKYRIHSNSCMARVKASGRYEVIRRFFLDWLQQYLSLSGIDDEKTLSLLQQSIWLSDQVRLKIPGNMRHSCWSLRVAGDNDARLISEPNEPNTVRVEINKVGSNASYDIQLNQSRLGVSTDATYELRFRARADALRPLSFGFAKGGEPWTNLGLYQQVQLTPNWQDFERSFVPTDNEENGRIHFDLGDSDIAAELSFVTLAKTNVKSPTNNGFSSRQQPYKTEERELVRQSSAGIETGLMSRDWGWDRGLPVDRYYIEAFLRAHSDDIKGTVLEIGDDSYARKVGGDKPSKIEIVDIDSNNTRATIMADITNAKHIEDESFDCIILTQTLQYVYDLQAAFRSLYRILKKNGVLLITVPASTGMPCKDPTDSWYWAFTPASMRRLTLEQFSADNTITSSYGNLTALIGFLRGLASEEIGQPELDHCDPKFPVVACVRAVKA